MILNNKNSSNTTFGIENCTIFFLNHEKNYLEMGKERQNSMKYLRNILNVNRNLK